MPDPSNYSSEDEWMEACVPTMVDEGRDQDQAVAACLNMWRERGLASMPKPIAIGEVKSVTAAKVNPNNLPLQIHGERGERGPVGEGRVAPFLDRAWSTLTVKSVDTERREIEGIASTPSVDRVGDIVEPMGAKFT